MECCRKCRYFALSGTHTNDGVCRRRVTPILIGLQQSIGSPKPIVQGFYTPMGASAWCGEYMGGQPGGFPAGQDNIEEMLKKAASLDNKTLGIKPDDDPA